MQINYTKWVNSAFLEEDEKEIILRLSKAEKLSLIHI